MSLPPLPNFYRQDSTANGLSDEQVFFSQRPHFSTISNNKIYNKELSIDSTIIRISGFVTATFFTLDCDGQKLFYTEKTGIDPKTRDPEIDQPYYAISVSAEILSSDAESINPKNTKYSIFQPHNNASYRQDRESGVFDARLTSLIETVKKQAITDLHLRSKL